MAEPPRINSKVPHPARVYDYWLGGKDNFEADRQAAEAGVRQFLDLGSGLPSVQNVHEVAQSIAPESRVVYVDITPRTSTRS